MAGGKTLRGACKNQPPSKYADKVAHLEGKERREALKKFYELNREKRTREYKPREKKVAGQQESKHMVKSKTGSKKNGSKKKLQYRKRDGEITAKGVPRPHDSVPLGQGSGQQGAPCDELTGHKAEAFGPLPLLDSNGSSKLELPDLPMEVSRQEENLFHAMPPGFIEDDSQAEFYCPWQNGVDVKEKQKEKDDQPQRNGVHVKEKEKDDQSELIAALRCELSLVKRKLRWHEEVRDWISAVGAHCAKHLIAQGMAPRYLHFEGALYSDLEASCHL